MLSPSLSPNLQDHWGARIWGTDFGPKHWGGHGLDFGRGARTIGGGARIWGTDPYLSQGHGFWGTDPDFGQGHGFGVTGARIRGTDWGTDWLGGTD